MCVCVCVCVCVCGGREGVEEMWAEPSKNSILWYKLHHLIISLLPNLANRPEEKAAASGEKKGGGKSKHPSSLSHSLFDAAGEENEEDDLFSTPSPAVAKKQPTKSKPAIKDMDALFDETDQGTVEGVKEGEREGRLRGKHETVSRD